ncbi:sensor domain-containing diguanylate cyclase [Vibrio maerlii]|uniref:sensor domain-containing diguanylate cyclase n=1 Tax=Vibrio maerlii TaxID=2231648 RepID=UPI0019D2FF35|nr:diguanylate cyclase [Vibrio maerlii]
MALPRVLIRFLRPYLVILTAVMVYLAYQQLHNAEKAAYQQSHSNIRTATALIQAQIEATLGKFYLLQNSWRENDLSHFMNLSERMLADTPIYADIIQFSPIGQRYRSMSNTLISKETLQDIKWAQLSELAPKFSISSIYEKTPGRWVFAVKHRNMSQLFEVWIEFDLLHTTQYLRDLKTLNHGYVFVVDKETERLVFHPDPSRIGTPSVSYHGGIGSLIEQGLMAGRHEYYYQDNFKLSVFDADNPMDWVFVSGTDRADILSTSYQFSLTATVIASLLLLAVIMNYLTYQLNASLSELNRFDSIADFKAQLRHVFDRFCSHQGLQFCLYDSSTHTFSTVDYHGNKTPVLTDKDLSNRFSPHSLSYVNGRYRDPLAKRLKITQRHYTIPLFDKEELIAVIYLSSVFPTYKSILRMVRDYSEVALTNLLLHHQLKRKDPMTGLDNKLTVRAMLDEAVKQQTPNGIASDTYFAILDIDNFKKINDTYGHLCGDAVIYQMASLMKKSFPRPKGVSLARYGGEEFCILFHANNPQDAKKQVDELRRFIEASPVKFEEHSISFTTSAGVTPILESQHATIGHADKSLYRAKNMGKNLVMLYEPQ